ncbi:hypothetical protein [Acinetobacter rathckeae]|uniref:hypothetical protein n=1 Tax=Acinetobacter rathckeae TaxID=2605272 RepID=UPI0018A33858|nr:hypothetical protein [Acinetobacter rathckeae]MBF7687049.1 hypothetical protein [Acinetobacter rathckeae]
MKNLALGVAVLVLAGCSSNDGDDYNNQYYQCVDKGIQYYKDIGSYPRLSSENISAEDKARQMCRNSLVAFGE